MREALFALASVESSEVVLRAERSDLPAIVERRMLAAPEHWQRYCPGNADEQYIARRYSYSDRMRYYWADQQIDAAVHTLLDNLRAHVVPEPVLSAFLPEQYDRIRAGALSADPKDLVVDPASEASFASTPKPADRTT